MDVTLYELFDPKKNGFQSNEKDLSLKDRYMVEIEYIDPFSSEDSQKKKRRVSKPKRSRGEFETVDSITLMTYNQQFARYGEDSLSNNIISEVIEPKIFQDYVPETLLPIKSKDEYVRLLEKTCNMLDNISTPTIKKGLPFSKHYSDVLFVHDSLSAVLCAALFVSKTSSLWVLGSLAMQIVKYFAIKEDQKMLQKQYFENKKKLNPYNALLDSIPNAPFKVQYSPSTQKVLASIDYLKEERAVFINREEINKTLLSAYSNDKDFSSLAKE